MIVEVDEIAWEYNIIASSVNWVLLAGYLNPSLLAIVCVLFVLGTTTMGWLFHAHRVNYIWLINRLFIPTLLNAFVGLLTIVINICTARYGDVFIMALLAIITIGLLATSSFTLTIMYKRKLKRLRDEHYNHRVLRRINLIS
ncbi:unnamed protein product [Penicillium salamii]|uniref:Uncharacterized protein n=1 Tax=Penicillium salamii TaxID=1612424 RepID=A0A9W4NWH3_9EURO|nr:unnamed protein product [Penicillium salamii]